MNNADRRIFVAFVRSELRRLNRAHADHTSAPVVYLPKNLVVCPHRVEQPAMAYSAMSLVPDTEAGRQRFAAYMLAGGSPAPVLALRRHVSRRGEA